MKIEIGTERLREAVSKAYLGAGNNNIHILTTIIGLEGRNGNLYLTTTDNSEVLTVAIKDVLPKDAQFYTNVPVDKFKKLVDKTQSPTVILSIEENKVVFTGNGDYNIEVQINNEDGEGSPARIVHYEIDGGETREVKTADIKKYYTYLKNYVADLESSLHDYKNYTISENYAFAYNTSSAALVETGFEGSELLPQSIVKLFKIIDSDTVKITMKDQTNPVTQEYEGAMIKVVSDNILITGSVAGKLDKTNIGRFIVVKNSTDIFTKETVIDRERLTSAFDRIAIFTTGDGSAYIDMEIDDKNIVFITNNKNCVESVPLEECNGNKGAITKFVNYDLFLTAASTFKSEKIHIAFGERIGIHFYDKEEKVSIIIPYFNPERQN